MSSYQFTLVFACWSFTLSTTMKMNNENEVEKIEDGIPIEHTQLKEFGHDEEISKQEGEQSNNTKRIATLDVFRGMTVAVMVLVDDAGGKWPRINHSPWNGCTLADLVMPSFLFIVGMSIALALKRIPKRAAALQKVFLRTMKLFLWGLILQGGYSHAPDDLSYGVDMKKIRWCGILQRIAFAYLVVSVIEIASTKTLSSKLPHGYIGIFKLYIWHWVAAIVIIVVYHSVSYGLLVPDWYFAKNGKRYLVRCGVRGLTGPQCNAVGYLDRAILGVNHLYPHPEWTRTQACDLNSPAEGPSPPNFPVWCKAPFEPEGVLSSISSILSCTVGIHYGHVLIHFKDHVKRLLHWTVPAICLLLLATILHFTHAIPLNKQLYSFSYVCFTAGAAGMVFSALYIVIDIFGVQKPTLLLQWMGMNAMFVYVMAAAGVFAGLVNGFYWNHPHNNLVNWIKNHIFIDVWHSERVGTLLYVLIAEILFWGLISGFLHKKRIYWKL